MNTGDEVADVDKPSVYIDMVGDVPKVVYRASAIHGCRNILLAMRLGISGAMPPDWLQDRFDAGHDHEPLILGKIQAKYGFQPYGFQMACEVPVGPNALIRGHIDCLDPVGNDPLITHYEGVELPRPEHVSVLDPSYSGKPIVVDAKALSQDSFNKWLSKGFEAFPYYGWQMPLYVFGFDCDGVVMAVKNKNTDAMCIDYYPANSAHMTPIGTIFGSVLEIERLASMDSPPVFEFPCDIEQYPCPYFFMHPDKKKVTVEDKAVAERIGLFANRRDECKEQIKLLEDEVREHEAAIADLVGGKVASAKTNYGTVSTYHASSSNADWEALATALDITPAEAKEKFTKKTESSKLSIRLTKPRPKRESSDGAA